MKHQMVFKRYEIKYLISKKQQEKIKEAMAVYMKEDKYGRSTICNLYFDTPDFLLIRRSMEKPVYKEKLRLRSYGIADENSVTFAEIKKKFNSVVYKRRIELPQKKAMEYLCGKCKVENSQISQEINYFLKFYKNLSPKVFISYEREAFYAKDDYDFRLTFDENILWRDYDLSLCKGIYGNRILKKDMVLMEVKTKGAIPLWLTSILNENHIYKTSFSKYGNAYTEIFYRNQDEINYAG